MSLLVLFRSRLEWCNYTCHYCPWNAELTRVPAEEFREDAGRVARIVERVAELPRRVEFFITPKAEYLVLPYWREAVARLCALRATKIQENDPEIFFTLGLINLAEKDAAKARVQFKAAVNARPDFLPAHLELAKMAMSQEDYAGAEESIRQILRAGGRRLVARRCRGAD